MTISVTPRLKLKKYSSGGDPHPTRVEFNAMIDSLEGAAAIHVSGITSARPAAGVRGRFYSDTTTGRVYLDDGTAWGEISSVGGGGGGAAVLVAGTPSEGTSDRAARADHTHSLALATNAKSGAMSAADKATLEGASSAGIAGALLKADASGRYAVATPSAASDVANKSYVDTQIGTRAPSDHSHSADDVSSGVLGSARLPAASAAAPGALSAADKKKLDAASSAATAGTLMSADSNGRYQAASPAAAGDVANKSYVDAQVGTRSPSNHSHSWSEIDSKPTTFAPSAHTHSWSDINGQPATYPPSDHSHSFSSITSRPSTYPPSSHTHSWSDINGQPSTYPPSAHTHSYSSLTGRPELLTYAITDARYAQRSHAHWWSDITKTELIYNTNAAWGDYRAVWVNNSGAVGYNLSSRKYKQDEREYVVPLGLLDTLRPKWFKYRGEVEEHGREATPERVNFMAEDLHDAGLREIVSYNGEGQLRENAETINEQLMVAPLWSLVSQLYDVVREQGEVIAELRRGE